MPARRSEQWLRDILREEIPAILERASSLDADGEADSPTAKSAAEVWYAEELADAARMFAAQVKNIGQEYVKRAAMEQASAVLADLTEGESAE